jgi:hydrogenase/urease accessory protein HupE
MLVLFGVKPASAHVLGLSRGDYTPRGGTVTAEVAMRTDDAVLVTTSLDADADGHVTDAELASARPALEKIFFGTLGVTSDGAPCDALLDDARFDGADGIRLRATYTCQRACNRLSLRFGFLARLPSDHRHLATVHLPKGDVDRLAVLADPVFDVEVGGAPSHGFASLLRAGVEHILKGADHLAFLLALVLGGTLVADRRARVGSLVAMLTAFTLGHSASLAIATLGGFAPGARFVEPAVALSVAYVGAENLFTRSVRHRWILTLLFGFVHGFAFAGGLLPLGLPRAQLPAALVAFNLGVEAGQLLVLGLLLPPLAALRSRAWYAGTARALSAAIVVAGVGWFIQRIA